MSKLLDSATGGFHFADTFILSAATTADELIHHFGADNVAVEDTENGWMNYTSQTINWHDQRFGFTFYFHQGKLSIINFYMPKEGATSENWADWSEDEELEKQRKYDEWLTSQIGTERKFDWGFVGAFYDKRSSWTFMDLRYNAHAKR